MPKYYCDYCDIFLTHDSASVRKAHNDGKNHVLNVKNYYAEIPREKGFAMLGMIEEEYGKAQIRPPPQFFGIPQGMGGPPGPPHMMGRPPPHMMGRPPPHMMGGPPPPHMMNRPPPPPHMSGNHPVDAPPSIKMARPSHEYSDRPHSPRHHYQH